MIESQAIGWPIYNVLILTQVKVLVRKLRDVKENGFWL